MMAAQTLKVIQSPTSIRDLVVMDDTGNIFIGSGSIVNRWYQLIRTNVLGMRHPHTQIHLAYPEDSVQDYDALAAEGAEIFIWNTHTSLPGSHLKHVIVPEDHALAQQHFFVVDTPSYARALVTWEVSNVDGYNGVLVTNPDQVHRLCDLLIDVIFG